MRFSNCGFEFSYGACEGIRCELPPSIFSEAADVETTPEGLLHKITEKKIYRERAGGTLQQFALNLEKGARGVPYLMMALDFYLHEPYRVVVAGKPGEPEFQKALHAVQVHIAQRSSALQDGGFCLQSCKT